MATLEVMNAKLRKLDTLENITISLQEEVSRGNSRIEELSNSIGSVNTDLAKYAKQWEEVSTSLENRLSKLEKKTKSWENEWELSRNSVAKDLKAIQSGVDENSKKTLEFENFLKKSENKWRTLHTLEGTIRKAAEKKFQELKEVIKTELRDEIMKEMTADTSTLIPPEIMQATKAEIKRDLLEVVQAPKAPMVTPDDQKALLDELDQAARAPGVTPADLKRLRDEVLIQVQSHTELRNEFRSHNNFTTEEFRYNKLKDQAFAKRLNIIVFGIID